VVVFGQQDLQKCADYSTLLLPKDFLSDKVILSLYLVLVWRYFRTHFSSVYNILRCIFKDPLAVLTSFKSASGGKF